MSSLENIDSDKIVQTPSGEFVYYNYYLQLLFTIIIGPLSSLPIHQHHRSVSSPVTVQSVGGEVLRLKRLRRMSSSEDIDSDKVVQTPSGELAYYTSSSPNSHAPAAIALPAHTAGGWTQADLEHAAIG